MWSLNAAILSSDRQFNEVACCDVTVRPSLCAQQAPEAMTGAGWRPVVGLPLVPAGEEGAAEGAAE